MASTRVPDGSWELQVVIIFLCWSQDNFWPLIRIFEKHVQAWDGVLAGRGGAGIAAAEVGANIAPRGPASRPHVTNTLFAFRDVAMPHLLALGLSVIAVVDWGWCPIFI